MASIIRSIFKVGRDGKPTCEIDKNCLWMFSNCNDRMIEARPLPDGPMYRVSPVTRNLQKPRCLEFGSLFEKGDMLYTWQSMSAMYSARIGGHDYSAYKMNIRDGGRAGRIVFFCGPSVNKNVFFLEEDCLISMEELEVFHSTYTLSRDVILDVIEKSSRHSLASRHGILLSDVRQELFAKILTRDFEHIKSLLTAQ